MRIFCFSVHFFCFLVCTLLLIGSPQLQAQVIFSQAESTNRRAGAGSLMNDSTQMKPVPKPRLTITYLELPTDSLETKVDGQAATPSVNLDSIQAVTTNYKAIRQTQFEIDSIALVMVNDSLSRLQRSSHRLTSTSSLLNLYRTIPSILPVRYRSENSFRISSPFGYRNHPVLGSLRFHNGIDLPMPLQSDVYATADGLVDRIFWEGDGLGLAVVLTHPSGYKTVYGHLDDHTVLEGQTIRRGEIIGHVGQTGLSTGTHLHYSVLADGIAIDPIPFLFLLVNGSKKNNQPTTSVQVYKPVQQARGYTPTIKIADELKPYIK